MPSTIHLPNATHAWGSPDFEEVLKQEVAGLGGEGLPLQQGLSTGSVALADDLKVMILDVADAGDCIRVRAGLFYTGIIAGCSCSDDPAPGNESSEYCEVQFDIHKGSGEATVSLLGG